jgi:hypothetical protein
MRTVRCEEESCKAEFVYLVSAKTGKACVPVDVETLSDDDLDALERGEDVTFDSTRGHVSHFKTCTNPRRFSHR